MKFGDTVCEPEVGTTPRPGSISALSAFVDIQLKVTLWPRSIDFEEIDSVTVGGGGGLPSIPLPSVIRITGTADNEDVFFPNLSPTGANPDSSSVRRNRRPRNSLRNPASTPGTSNHSGSVSAAWWKSFRGTYTPSNGSFPPSSRSLSLILDDMSGLKRARPAPIVPDSSTNRANSCPNWTGSTLTSTPDCACR